MNAGKIIKDTLIVVAGVVLVSALIGSAIWFIRLLL